MNIAVRAFWLAAAMTLFALGGGADAAAITDCLIYAGERVTIGIGSTINGLVCSGHTVVGDARLGGGSTVNGDVRAGDDVALNNGAVVTGTVTNPGSFTMGAGASVFNHVMGTPDLPSLPPVTAFVAGTTDRSAGNGGTLILAPGSYGAVNLGGNATLNLSAGTYFFDSLTSGLGLDLNLDVSGGSIRILSVHNIGFGGVDMSVSDGTAADIYFETHEVGDNAFRAGGGADVLGTIYAPYGNIHIGSGSSSGSFEGYLWSGGVVYLEHDIEGTPVLPVPEPATVTLLGVGLAGLVASQAWRKRRAAPLSPLD
jgi:PEP-CTERM motif